MPSPPILSRIDFPRAGHAADANIHRRYPADSAAWIWHPLRLNETTFLRFTLEVECDCEEALELQVSADQRFQLSLDGVEFAFGPDRSDVAHWSLQTYRGALAPGRHTLSALVWWIADAAYGVPDSGSNASPPMAQCSFRGGFLLAALGDAAERFNTGAAPWKVEDLTHAVSLEKKPIPGYHDIGPAFTIDAAKWSRPGQAATPVTVRQPVDNNNATGVARPGWRLETTPLPEQQRGLFHGGKIREVREGTPSLEAWQNLIARQEPLRFAPHESATVLWDLEDYRCGYPHLQTRGGHGASVSIEWAEALYETDGAVTELTSKGDRDETAGKQFLGFGDRFLCSGEPGLLFPAFWWRSGRFIQIRVTTADEPLVIERLGLQTTRYPLECESRFESSDPDLSKIAALAVNTMQQGTHELFADSPYYEQMAYVGDNVTEALVSYAMTGDTRITRRAIELFDWSRAITGLVAERWPCACYQGSATYAMLWPSMVRNHAWWRDEPEFIRECLRGVRHLIEELLVYRGSDGLLNRLPGWSFVDWVPEWQVGYPPGHETGDSSIIQLHWILCLQAAAELEEHFGEPELRQRLQRLEIHASETLVARYRCPESGLFYDDGERRHLSEHANVLASLAGLRSQTETDWPEELARRPHARCTVYFTHYLLEALRQEGRGDLFFSRLGLWRSFLDYGLHTIPEQPEPTRSDCHAWGAHPLYHVHASIAGIRPASPGFRSVRVRPMLGSLEFLEGSLPHPQGEIRYNFRVEGGRLNGFIVLPEGITGTLETLGEPQPLAGGKDTFSFLREENRPLA
ncbi:MAG: alpha-L-rhamnosidase C-terminal domain-containing protein [Terrimicrobiaceae bacterium]